MARASFLSDAEGDSASIVSFDDIPRQTVVGFDDIPRHPVPVGMPAPPRVSILKIDGKVPDVLYKLKYLGWNDKVVQCRQSDAPFKDIPEFEDEDDLDDEDKMGPEKPVIEIVTKVFTSKSSGRPSHRRQRGGPPVAQDRPITETFDQNMDYRYEDYYTDEEDDLEASTPDIARPFMVIHSEYLINALKAVIAYYPFIKLDGKTVNIPSPYRVLYHHRPELEAYKDSQPAAHDEEYAATTKKHIDILLKFLEDNLGKEIHREEERHQLDVPMATYEYFWLLLKPGEVFYAKRYDIWTPFVISSIRISSNVAGQGDVYKVNCWMLETNGTKVNRYMYNFNVAPWLGEQAISSLTVIPAAFWPEDLDARGGISMREKCIGLGKLYWELLKRPTYMEYDGLLVNSGGHRKSRGPTGFMRGRVICDAQGFDAYYHLGPDCMRGMARYHRPNFGQTTPPVKDHLPRNKPRCGCLACAEDRPSRNDGPYLGFEDLDPLQDSPPDSDLFYLVLSNTIPAFILGDRRWGHLFLDHLQLVVADKEAFKYLVLDDEVKMTVKALIGKFATDLGDGHVSPWGNDFVRNKGEGRIFLLHGTPGVGKTCTAECVAELTNRPLISLTSGDLSVDSFNIEANLSYFLELGQRYGALVLLDEADVYLERRRPKDISRNGLVSVFLRALEYYRGVLFLTTNRVQSFDGAFLSRIHVSLHYKNLRDEDRERIWANNFDRLSRDSSGRIHVSVAAREFVWNSRDVRSLKWNGREIRNAMQTALALAEADAQEENTERITIAEKHLRAVVKMSRGFRDYIKGSAPIEGFDEGDDEDSSEEDTGL